MYGLPDDFASWYYNFEPDAGYNHWLRSLGLSVGQTGGNQAMKNFAYGLYNRYQGDYKGQSADNPNLSWTDYLSRQDPFKDFMSLSPEQRGERPGYYQPRLRWVNF